MARMRSRCKFEHCLKDSRGHERDVDIYLRLGIVLTKQSMLSPESESTT